MRKISYVQALNEAIREEMRRDSSVFIYGEDVGLLGGVMGVTRGLLEEFGEERVRGCPLSETAIAGSAVGAAITGTRPIAEIMYADFLAVCFDEVFNKAAKWRYAHGGQFTVPLVIRTAMGAAYGTSCEHSQCPEALFMHTPGLKIALPSNAYDAKGLLKTAIRDDNPVLFFEHKLLYRKKDEVPEEEYLIPFGKAKIKRNGKDITVLATSLMVERTMEASQELSKDGIDLEVIDLRTIVPLDKETILNSVNKTGHLVIVEEANQTGSVGGEIAAIFQEEAFNLLKKPVKRISSLDVPIPYNLKLESYVIPSIGRIREEIKNFFKKSKINQVYKIKR